MTLCRRQSPTYHYFVVNSTNVVIEQMNMQSNSDNENQAKNTDGIGMLGTCQSGQKASH